MTEQIGNVILDLTDYGGEDLYCDGEVEDTLLAIARDHKKEEFPRIIEEQKNWPVLYHLSPFRENIVSWLPMTKHTKVLEIGAGCGAITGALAKRAGHVTCVDLSKKRSMINAYRHRECGNVTIRVGNFKDIEPGLDTDYDLVLLIGVFEYGQGYMDTETPYEDFLNIIRRHCAADGRIVIAIENQYGLKYFAGCKEDHVGDYFTGLEGYPAGGGVRTFGRDGLIRLMERCGVKDYYFYYPYPDYKFMTTLYSDDYLPCVGELTNNMRNFDRERMALFDEKNVFDGLIREGRFAEFSNSFLIVIGEKPRQNYVKYSNDRAPQYAIRTEICGTGDDRYVEKQPDMPEAAAHIESLLGNYEKLCQKYEGSGLSVNTCRPAEHGVQFAYVEGGTLEEALDECLYHNDEEGFRGLLSRYEEIAAYREQEPVSDHDLIFANILIGAGNGAEQEEEQSGSGELIEQEEEQSGSGEPIEQEEEQSGNGEPAGQEEKQSAGRKLHGWKEKLEAPWTLIDYEWTFPEAESGGELTKRAMFIYASGPEIRRRWLFEHGIAQQYGITPDNLTRLQGEETVFQQRVTGGRRSMAQLYGQMGKPVTPVRDLVLADQALEPFRRFQVYVDTGKGFSEEQSFFVPHVYEDRSRLNVRVSFGGDVQALRLDPALVPCMLYGTRICVNGRCIYERMPGTREAYMAPDCTVSMNGISAAGGAEVFITDDPNVTVVFQGTELPKENELTMEAGIVFLTEESAKSLYPEMPVPEGAQDDTKKRKAFWRR